MRTPEDTRRDAEIRDRRTEPTRELEAAGTPEARDELARRARYGDGEASAALARLFARAAA